MSRPRTYLKRVADFTIGSILLFLTSPLILVGAVAVRLESSGPAIFRQVRVGKGRRPFTLYKLRTMRVGAELGSDITVKHDERVTRIGHFLRRTRVDELPQLWNVVRGDMSLVGPRPELPRIVDRYPPSWAPLLEVRPGLTDEATLAFSDEATLLGSNADSYEHLILPAKAQVALAGVQKQSLLNDFSILLRTAALLSGLGRRREHPAVAKLRGNLPQRRAQDAA